MLALPLSLTELPQSQSFSNDTPICIHCPILHLAKYIDQQLQHSMSNSKCTSAFRPDYKPVPQTQASLKTIEGTTVCQFLPLEAL